MELDGYLNFKIRSISIAAIYRRFLQYYWASLVIITKQVMSQHTLDLKIRTVPLQLAD
jgi:hypothetical protein